MPGTKTNLKLHWNNFLITLCKFSFTILNLKWLCEPIYTQVTIFIRNKMHVWKHLLYLWVILNYKYIHICYETSLLLWNTKCDENFRFTDYDEVVWLYITWSIYGMHRRTLLMPSGSYRLKDNNIINRFIHLSYFNYWLCLFFNFN